MGVYIFGANTSGNVVQGNYIGTNVDGTAALTNSVIGVLIYQSSGNITVRDNLISGNSVRCDSNRGLEIAGGTASGNLVQGNLIGTNAGGTTAIPNGLDGILINDAPNNTIGGTAAGAGNTISGNGSSGIQLIGLATTGNVVQGNALGLDSAGNLTLPNQNAGIFANTAPLANVLGGPAPGQANRGQGVLFTVRPDTTSTPVSPPTNPPHTHHGTRVRTRHGKTPAIHQGKTPAIRHGKTPAIHQGPSVQSSRPGLFQNRAWFRFHKSISRRK